MLVSECRAWKVMMIHTKVWMRGVVERLYMYRVLLHGDDDHGGGEAWLDNS